MNINPHTSKHLTKKLKLLRGKSKASSTNGAVINEYQHADECEEIYHYPYAQSSNPNELKKLVLKSLACLHPS